MISIFRHQPSLYSKTQLFIISLSENIKPLRPTCFLAGTGQRQLSQCDKPGAFYHLIHATLLTILCFLLSRKMSVFADLKIKQPAHSLRSYFISFVSCFLFLQTSLELSSLINCYSSGPWRLEKHESRDENCLCKFRNSRLIFSKQFLTVTQERMFKALIPVKFEICVWSESED